MIYEESGSILFRSCDFPPFLLLRKISGVGGPQFVVLNIWDSVLANRFLLGMGGEQAALVAGSRWGWFSVGLVLGGWFSVAGRAAEREINSNCESISCPAAIC